MEYTHRDCIAYLEAIRWKGNPKCPYCESSNSTALERELRHHCNSCYTSYSVTVGTLFHKTHVDLPKWFKAIPLVLTSPKGISVRKLAKKIGVGKNTAAYMIVRIRKARTEEKQLLEAILTLFDQSD